MFNSIFHHPWCIKCWENNNSINIIFDKQIALLEIKEMKGTLSQISCWWVYQKVWERKRNWLHVVCAFILLNYSHTYNYWCTLLDNGIVVPLKKKYTEALIIPSNIFREYNCNISIISSQCPQPSLTPTQLKSTVQREVGQTN